MISRLVTRYAIFEATYLDQRSHTPSIAQFKLSEELIVLYTSMLKYLSRAIRYYKFSSGERLARSFVQSSQSMKELLGAIASKESEVEKVAQIVDAERTSLIINVDSLSKETAQRIQSLQRLMQSFERPLTRLTAPLDNLQNRLNSEEQRSLLRWLSLVPYRADHRKVYNDVLLDTGGWLLKKQEFRDWRETSSSSMFHLHGMPGSGKTKLTSIVIQRFMDNAAGIENAAPLAYFYCSDDRNEPTRSDLDEILRAIVKQLGVYQSGKLVSQAVITEYTRKQLDAEQDGLDIAPLSFQECSQLILSLTAQSSATIVIDGLDAVKEGREELLDALHYVVESSSSVVKVFISSREDADIILSLQSAISVCVEPSQNSDDVSVVVNDKVSNAIAKKKLLRGEVSQYLRQHLMSVLIDGANGMFLWPSLMIQYLCNQHIFKTEEDVMSALTKLPPTLESIFDRIYKRIETYEERAKQYVESAFSLLLALYSSLPLRVLKAVATSPSTANNDHSKVRFTRTFARESLRC